MPNKHPQGFASREDAIQALLGGGDVAHFNAVDTSTPLASVAVEYRGGGNYIADFILPMLPVPKRKHTIRGIDPNRERFRRKGTERPPGGEANLIDRNFDSAVTVNVTDHALADLVPDEEEVYADEAIASAITAVQDLTEVLKIDKEVLCRDLIDTAVTATSAITGDYSAGAGDPEVDAQTAIAAIKTAVGFRPNRIAMDCAVYEALRHHPNFLARMDGHSGPGDFDDKKKLALWLLGAADGELVVADTAPINTAAKGQSPAMADIWGERMLYYYAEAPRPRYRGLGLTCTNDNVLKGVQGRDGMAVESFRVPRRHSDMHVVHMFYDQVITNAGAGYLFTGALS
ncbi:MAG: hypothetical protein KDA41_08570 [Planctomycetales bacterium]|nr:hypothetical protein [Planctomycetales bacterium]